MNESGAGEKLRLNVKKYRAEWLIAEQKSLGARLHSEPPEHPGDLFYSLEKISQYALELAMLDWREGADPSAHLTEIPNSFAGALDARPDILPGALNPGFMAILSDMLDWELPFDTRPPGKEAVRAGLVYMDRWIIAGLADSSCWPERANAPVVKNKFINKCLDDYWALLTDQVDAEEGVARCIKNYERRATNQAFKAVSSYRGGDQYNELYVDYTLAAILKKRGLSSNSVHDWVWG